MLCNLDCLCADICHADNKGGGGGKGEWVETRKAQLNQVSKLHVPRGWGVGNRDNYRLARSDSLRNKNALKTACTQNDEHMTHAALSKDNIPSTKQSTDHFSNVQTEFARSYKFMYSM